MRTPESCELRDCNSDEDLKPVSLWAIRLGVIVVFLCGFHRTTLGSSPTSPLRGKVGISIKRCDKDLP